MVVAKPASAPTRYGVHLSVAKGYPKAFERGKAIGCTTAQIFARNPMGWKSAALAAEDAEACREALKVQGIAPLIVHTSYLINLGSPTKKLFAQSAAALQDEFGRAHALGAEYVVLHPGKHMGKGLKRGQQRIGQGIDLAMAQMPRDVSLLLEMTAGQGTEIGSRASEIADLLGLVTRSEALGVCFDTAHAYAAGYDLGSAEGLDRCVEELDDAFGLKRIRAIHLNDSKAGFGERVDRHEHLGLGKIGLVSLGRFLRLSKLGGIPRVLETPIDSVRDDAENLRIALALDRGELPASR